MNRILLAAIAATLFSCTGTTTTNDKTKTPVLLEGSWQLLTGTLIENGDTAVTDYTKNVSFIKIINDTHFAFMQHDLNKGQDSGAVFVSGGGRYTLTDSLYTEHLEYCSARNWEGNDFSFTVTIKGDTLIQSGAEIIESEGINRLNIEKYIRMKN
jgi:hypothetical protein